MWWVGALVMFTLIMGGFIFAAMASRKWLIATTAVFMALSFILWAGAFELLSRPKPIAFEWRHLAGSEIIGVKLVENVAIYLWLDRAGEPVTYVLPWSVGDAQSLQDGIKRMGEQGGGKMVFGRIIDGVPESPMDGDISTVIPPPAMKPKTQ